MSNSAHRVSSASIAWHIRRRNSVQLSEKHREKSVFDKSECEVALVNFRPWVDVEDGVGNVSSSTGLSAEGDCDICFNS